MPRSLSRLPAWPRFVCFFLGLLVMSLGNVMMIKPGLGAPSWDILHFGLAKHLPLLSVGSIILLVGLLIVLFNLFLGIRPSIGLLLNVLIVGPLMQSLLALIPKPETTLGAYAMFVAGAIICGVGVSFYISPKLGSGPRDGMMIGLSQRLKLPIGVTKYGIDLLVSLIGWRLGGPLGFGSLLTVFLLGPAVQLGHYLVGRLAAVPALAPFVAGRPVSQ